MATPMISAKELNQLREIRAFHEYSNGLTDNERLLITSFGVKKSITYLTKIINEVCEKSLQPQFLTWLVAYFLPLTIKMFKLKNIQLFVVLNLGKLIK